MVLMHPKRFLGGLEVYMHEFGGVESSSWVHPMCGDIIGVRSRDPPRHTSRHLRTGTATMPRMRYEGGDFSVEILPCCDVYAMRLCLSLFA